MCVGCVCTQPPYNDKKSFFLSTKIFTPFSKRAAFLCDVKIDVTTSVWRPLPRLLIDSSILAQTALVSYLRPALSELSSVVSTLEQM